MSLNQCNFIGNLTRDPELRYTPSNMAITSFGLALNHKWKDKATGDMKEEVTFIDCEAWGKTGEIINQYFKKGAIIFLSCRAKLDQWEDKNGGGKRSKVKFVVDSFEFCGGGKREESGEEDQTRKPQGQQRPPQKQASKPQPQQQDDSDPSIPF